MAAKFNFKSDFFKSTLLLSSGTVLAQAISYLLLPIITRLFTPEDFGEFGILMRIVGFIAVVGAASYEFAIPLPKKDEHAFYIYRIALHILFWTVGLTFFVGLVYWLMSNDDYKLILALLLVCGISGFTIFISIGRYWAIRTDEFKSITTANILTSGVTNLSKVFAGLAGFGFFGLAIAAFLGLAIGSFIYLLKGWKLFRKYKFSRSSLRQKAMAKKYRHFPKIDLPHNVMNAVRELLIAFFLSTYFSTAMFGSFDHSFRMLKIPLLLIGASIGQVLYSKLSKDFAIKKSIYPLVRKSVAVLIAIGFIPFTIIYFWGIPIFTFVFGIQWKMAGEISVAIAPWLFANFVASSISIIPAIIGKLKWFFWVSFGVTIVQLLCFGLLPQLINLFSMEGLHILFGISWLFFVLFTVMVIWMMNVVKKADDLNIAN